MTTQTIDIGDCVRITSCGKIGYVTDIVFAEKELYEIYSPAGTIAETIDNIELVEKGYTRREQEPHRR